MKRTFMIVLAILAIAVACFAADTAKAQNKSSQPVAAKAQPTAETLDNVKLSEKEQLKVQNFRLMKENSVLKQQILQLQLNMASMSDQCQLMPAAKAELEQIAKDHKLKDVEFDANSIGLVPAKKEPVQNATPSASK